MVCCSSQIVLSEFPGNNSEDESADDHSHWYMSRWGVDWMSVADGSKDLIEEFDHLSPLPHESLGKGVNIRSDPKLYESISALFALVKGKMGNENAKL